VRIRRAIEARLQAPPSARFPRNHHIDLPRAAPAADKPPVPNPGIDHINAVALAPHLAVVGLDLGATRRLPWRSLIISPCATCGGINQAQKASRSMFLAAVLPLPQADKETIFT